MNLSETLLTTDISSGEFVVSPSNGAIHCTISDPTGTVIYQKAPVNEGKFSFVVSNAGEHKICFSNPDGDSKVIKLTMETGRENVLDSLAKRDNLKPLERQLNTLIDSVQQAQFELDYLKGREELMAEMNESTSSRLLGFTFFTIVVLTGITASQVVYMKKFLKSKNAL